MNSILIYLQLIVSVLLVASILLQQRGQALGSAFGGGEAGFYATRRGLQKKLFWASIVLGALFIALSLLNIVF